MEAFVKPCEHCNEPLLEKMRGRPQRFCSDRCRQAHRKFAFTAEEGLRYRMGRPKLKSTSQDSDLAREFEPEKLSQKSHLRFERVNEVTFKLTDGQFINVPASHGHWGGYRTTKAVAWVINVGPGQWLARCRDEASGPSSFIKAKANALAIARGACGDYFIENSIDHLHGLQARLEDRQNNKPPAAGATSGAKVRGNRFSK
jgi:hypothetical protein